MPSPSTKERKAKFYTDNLIFRKKPNLSGCFDIEYNSAESLTKTSTEQIANGILSGRVWINRRDARIARKNYPDFDSFDANKKLAIIRNKFITSYFISTTTTRNNRTMDLIIYYKCHHQNK